MKRAATPADIRVAVLEIFVRTGKEATVKEIAAEIGCGGATVRGIMNDHGGSVDGITFCPREKPRYSTDYPSFEVGGVARTYAWVPTMRVLQSAIRAARDAAAVAEARARQEVKP